MVRPLGLEPLRTPQNYAQLIEVLSHQIQNSAHFLPPAFCLDDLVSVLYSWPDLSEESKRLILLLVREGGPRK